MASFHAFKSFIALLSSSSSRPLFPICPRRAYMYSQGKGADRKCCTLYRTSDVVKQPHTPACITSTLAFLDSVLSIPPNTVPYIRRAMREGGGWSVGRLRMEGWKESTFSYPPFLDTSVHHPSPSHIQGIGCTLSTYIG